MGVEALVYIVFAFLSGSVLFSYHIPLWTSRVDVVASSPDHNPGTANAFRLAGVSVGFLCLMLDMGKGFLPVWLAIRRLGPSFTLLPLVMAAPAVGHAFSPWYPFHGGKAIATSFGVLAGLLPHSLAVWALVFWYLFFSLVLVVRPDEKRSVAVFLLFSITCALGALHTGGMTVSLGCALLSMAPIVRNQADVRRAKRAMERADGASNAL